MVYQILFQLGKSNLLQKNILAFIFAIAIFFAFPIVVHASTFTVDSTGDGADAAIDGLCADSGGKCTLRAAITESNNAAGPHTINFNIPTSDSGYVDYDLEGTPSSGDSLNGDDFWTIKPASALPNITATGVTINGATQTTNQGNFNSSGPEIQIAGMGLATTGVYFTSTATNSTLNSVIINRFATRQLRVDANGFTITNSYIGTNITSEVGYTGQNTLTYFFRVNNLTIGHDLTDGNVFGQNYGAGSIFTVVNQIDCSTTSQNTGIIVRGNRFGLSKNNQRLNPFNSTVGLAINDDCDIEVGGSSTTQRNYFAGTGIGLNMSASTNIAGLSQANYRVYNNYFGTDSTGTLNYGHDYSVWFGNDVETDGYTYTSEFGGVNKGNLLRYSKGHHFRIRGERNLEIKHNTISDGVGIAWIMLGAQNNKYKDVIIKNNYFGKSSADPYFGLSTGPNSYGFMIRDYASPKIYGNKFVGETGVSLNIFPFISGVLHNAQPTVGGQSTLSGSLCEGKQYNCFVDPATPPIISVETTPGNESTLYADNRFTNTLPGSSNVSIVQAWFAGFELFTGTTRRTDLADGSFNIKFPQDTRFYTANLMWVGDYSTLIAQHPNKKVTCLNGVTDCPVAGSTSGQSGYTESLQDAGDNQGNVANRGYMAEEYRILADGTVEDFADYKFDEDHLVSKLFSFDANSLTDPVVGDRAVRWTTNTLATRNVATSDYGYDQLMDVEVVDANPILQDDGTYIINVDSTTDEDNVSSVGYNDGAGAYSGGGMSGPGGISNGKTSLREAIIVANNFNPATEVKIAFNIPTSDTGYRDYDAPDTPSSGNSLEGDDFWKIIPATLLPTITASDVTIDGATQTTNQNDKNTNGPEIQIHGSAATLATGLNTTATSTTINGLVVSLFTTQVQLSGNNGIVTNSYINVDPKGFGTYTTKTNGISIGAVTNIEIGHTTSDGNVIGKLTAGILAACGSSGAKVITIAGNFIGINKDVNYTVIGTTTMAGINVSGDCQLLVGGSLANNRNYIGGMQYGFFTTTLSATAVPKLEFYNNFFGTDPSGLLNRANSLRHIFIGNGANFASTTTQYFVGAQGKGNLFRFIGASGRQFHIQGLTKKTEISYNTFSDANTGTFPEAISLNSPSSNGAPNEEALIEHNFFGESTSDPYFGLATTAVTYPILPVNRAKSLTIQNNEFHGGRVNPGDTNAACIYMLDAGLGGAGVKTIDVIIRDNIIDGCENGINQGMEYQSMLIEGNTITNNLRDGIVYSWGDAGIIRDNIITANDLAAINLKKSGTSNPGNAKLWQNNIIYGNNITSPSLTEIQIELTTGSIDSNNVIANDPGDVDSGYNDQQNWPQITVVDYLGSGIYRVYGVLDGKVSEAPFQIELCKSDNHASGHGGCSESLDVVTTASAPDSVSGSNNYFNWTIDVTISESDGTDEVVFTSVATNNINSTSQFGSNFDTATNSNYTYLQYPIELVSPINDVEIEDPTPLLDWNPSALSNVANPEVDHYDVYVDGVKFASVNDPETSYQVTESQRFAYNTTHTWYVIAYRVGDIGTGRSEEESFTVVSPKYDFTLEYPVDVTIDDKTPLFNWTDIEEGSDATHYEVFVDDEFYGLVNLSTSEFESETELTEGEHNWQVIAYYKDINGKNVEVAKSGSAKFTISFPVVDELPDTGEDGGKYEVDNPGGGNGVVNEKPKEKRVNIEVLTFTPLVIYGGIGTSAILLSLITVGFVNTVKRLEVILAVLVPKKRKYWGIIFNENNLNPLPFAVVRLFDKDRKLVSSIASDLNGRYGFLVNKADNYILEIEAEGFNKYRNEFYVDPDREVVKDIAVQRTNESPNVVNRLRFYIKNNFVPFMNIFGLIIMLIGLVWTLYVISTKGIDQITFAGSLIYICLFVFNILFLVTSIMREIGKVKDILTGSGVGGASVRFYNEERQIDISLTNAKGEIKANMKPGKYKIKVYKPGYEMVGEDLKEMNLKKEGYLEEDINMAKSSEENGNNPFKQ